MEYPDYRATEIARAPRIAGIYAIVNTLNGRWYVGQSQNIGWRWRGHVTALRGRCHHARFLQRSWTKHGEDVFVFRVIEVVDDCTQLTAREQYWMDSRPRAQCYNTSPAADSNAGMKFGPLPIIQRLRLSQTSSAHHPKGSPFPGITAESIRKRNESNRGKKRSQEYCERNRARLMGHPVSQETRDKISAAHRGRKLSAEHRKRISESEQGRVFSPEHRAKLQVAVDRRKAAGEFNDPAILARLNTPEAAAKRIAAATGKKRSPEARENMRQARLRYLAQQRSQQQITAAEFGDGDASM